MSALGAVRYDGAMWSRLVIAAYALQQSTMHKHREPVMLDIQKVASSET
jgi:hypothetical protein